jgi:hypothetical protein
MGEYVFIRDAVMLCCVGMDSMVGARSCSPITEKLETS